MTTDAFSSAMPSRHAVHHWGSQGAWCILHTEFGTGAHFLRAWAAWRADPQRPRMLHYVAMASQTPDLEHMPTDPVAPGMEELMQGLRAQCFGLRPGQHRLCFDEGRVLLTLCIGPRLPMLRQQQFEADDVVLAAPPSGAQVWDEWDIKALVRCCRRGTHLALLCTQANLPQWLRQSGFDSDGVFNPRWEIKTTREPWRRARGAPQTCAVIGAGISGASVAASLARRGWQVVVLDQADTPAAGASALPVGLAVPHFSADDCVLSRLSRAGVRLSLQQTGHLLEKGQDWAPSGVHEQQFDDSAVHPLPSIWHAHAGWIKPAALVRAWLHHPHIRFQGGVSVQSLQRCATGWTLLDPAGHAITTVARVVLANASGAVPLLQHTQAAQPALHLGLEHLPAVYSVRGQVSWAVHDAPEKRPFPPGPVNGNGSLIPFVPFGDERRWFVGASYQPMGKPEWPDDKNHGANVMRLDKLLPALSEALTPVFEAGALNAWKGVRCVTADRLPMLGSVQDDDSSLWICAGMGSRGLGHAPLCAELLAAQWAGEPLPIEVSLARLMHARRHRVEALI